MKKQLAKLIDLKSIITVMLVVTLILIVLRDIHISDESIKTLFVSTASSVFTYYFTKKSSKSSGNDE